ncbi:putative leucine-rich repeat-containing protein DDB_G0290503 isoform X1 [Olea europaea var. sylvestris]|uniref:putative leucine-rich repeat-containing protein DDB_G0290503 isoform X1 n=1 Tax=Olea europaea var. sylvestris TaxID=158386 RepID=UPI000C1D7A0F|nr:putative leucine-rich repeat-containing protein DDB_G0290503 isoform X1 [Olea europaea var. sylvestris]
MSRITKWKLEKTKVKAVFRLQFHATDVPQSGWDKLFISLISADSGKATAKTTKTSVRSGTCKWADPIYETTNLLQNSKSKQYDEKLCKLVVAMGSSRASILGEAIINLADYADALKPCAIALPLQGCNFGTILHVTVQLLTSKTGFREFEQQRELRERGLLAGVDGQRGDSGTGKISRSDENSIEQMDKEKGIIRLRSDVKDLSSAEEDVSLNEEYADLGVGIDDSSNNSESLYAEKHETSSMHEIDSLKSMVSDDLNGLSCCQSLHTEKGDPSDHQIRAQGSSDLAHRWNSDYSMDNELAISHEENNRLRGGLELAESSILDLKMEVSSLQSLADELGIETRKFSDLIVTEKSSVEELTKEVSFMKSECLQFKEDIETLKELKLSPQMTIQETSINQGNHLLQNIQVKWLKKISVVEDTIRELQNEACVGFHESNSRFIYSKLEAVLAILLDIKCRNGEVVQKGEQYLSANELSTDSFQPESILHHLSVQLPESQVPNSNAVIDAMKGQILDLVRELDEAKVEREGEVKKMNQMECYYEALIQELEENQKRMIGELQSLRNEHSTCLYTISADRAEIESMRQDMNHQVLRFANERRGLDALNNELEKRAATSEAALRRARLNYSIAVDKLQKDLELLSSQVVSMFETNENIIKQAFPESPPPCLLGNPKILQSQEDYDPTKVLQNSNQNLGPRKQAVGGDILLEDLKRSLYLQEGLYQKVEEELGEMHSVNLNLDIYSKTLQEMLLEANADINMINGKNYELAEELELSNAVKNQLIVRLQKAMDDIQTLNEYKSSCIAQCSDMALQNQILEEKLESISKENFLLTQKLIDCKELVTEYKSYQSKFETCLAENAELSLLLKHEASENANLQNEISLLKENLTMLKAESDELASVKEKLQENICFMKDKLATLLLSYSKQFRGLAFFSNSQCLDECTDFKDAILQLEEIQQSASGKILQLLEEKKILESERVSAEMSLSAAKSEILATKQKFKCDMQDMAAKLDVSNALVDNLQVQFKSVADKFHHTSEIEERSAKQNRELLDYLALLQDQMQELTSKNGHIAQEMLGLDTLAEELGNNKSTIMELIQDNQDLRVNLQDKTGESIKLASEISCLEGKLRNIHNELQIEKGFKDELEGKMQDLASQLNKEHDKVIYFEQQKTELTHFRQVASDLELEKSRLHHLLNQQNRIMEKLQKSSSRTTDFESQLFEMQDYSIAADVKLAYITNQYQTLHEEHVTKFEGDMQDMADKLVVSNALVDKLQVQLEFVADKFHLTSEIEEKSAQQNRELLADLTLLQDQMQELTSKNGHIAQDVLGLDALAEELERNNSTITELRKDKKDLMVSLQDRTGESIELASEVSCLKENLRKLHEELRIEKGFKDELEEKMADLKVQLNKEHDRVFNFEQQKTELMHFRQVASDLEFEKSRLSHHLTQQNEFMERLRKSSYTNDLESQLFEMLEYSIAADVKLAYVTKQYEILLQELVQQLKSSDEYLLELQKRYHDLEAMLNQRLASEVHLTEENSNLLTSFKTLRTEFEASVAQNKLLSDSNHDINYQLEEYKRKLTMMQTSFSKDNLQAVMVEQLKDTLAEAEEDIHHLTLLKEELEILSIVLKGKVDEQYTYMTSLEDNRDELLMLRSRCNVLSHKLSEQVMKTEEFKNLSIHLKELKDRAEAESSHAREKREPEGPPVIMQDTLRIAFIKEQYETKIQELKQQLSISKKHGEEMLMKLQDSIDEIENRKKSEAVNMKRNNELSFKLLELETELQSVLAEKREKVNAYDRINAELECVALSLECCKEEKEKLEASFRECEVEKSQLAVELDSIKELKKFRSFSNVQKEENNEVAEVEYVLNESSRNSSPNFFCSVCSKEMDAASLGMHGIPEVLVGGELLQNNGKSLNVSSDHLATQRLKSSIEHMHEELEKMKTENTHFLKDRDFDPDFQDPEEELVQLHKVNNELRSMFPSFNEISTGNALERVLALEIELAESMKTKNKSNIHFQSSFLKQHSDEEAVFKSFRDINELIKQMLEIKGSRAAVEAELREMHDRYSQLSLQFAEVEGERQKLKMTLKNIRASKKL